MAAVLAGSSFAACGPEDAAEICFEVIPKRADNVGICNYTQAELTAIAGGQDADIESTCYPLGQCPDACDGQRIIDEESRPVVEAERPDLIINDTHPLCLEQDVAANQCCFWVMYAGYSEN